MGYCLADAVHVSRFPDATVVLKLKEDRYVLLSGALHDALHRTLAGHDLSEAEHALATRLVHGSILKEQTAASNWPDETALSSTSGLKSVPKRTVGWDFPIIFMRLLATVVEVKRRPLFAIVSDLCQAKAKAEAKAKAGVSEKGATGDTCPLSRLSAAMAVADLIMGANRWCLPRAICTMRWLLARGYCPHMVMAVTERPFEAHSWVELGGYIVTDTPDRVRPFTPILVL